MLVSIVDEYEFRKDLGEYFSDEACQALFEWYDSEAYGDSEHVIYDPVAIRCEWTEYDSIDEAYADLIRDEECETEGEMEEALNEIGLTLMCSNGHILFMQ